MDACHLRFPKATTSSACFHTWYYRYRQFGSLWSAQMERTALLIWRLGALNFAIIAIASDCYAVYVFADLRKWRFRETVSETRNNANFIQLVTHIYFEFFFLKIFNLNKNVSHHINNQEIKCGNFQFKIKF